MTPTRWRRLQTIVDAALNLPPAERAEYLERTCDGDEALRREAQNLIDSDEQAGDFFEHAIQAGANAAIRAGAGCAPECIGRYRILRVLGEGGMGLVYEAEQEQPRRLVALKVIKPTLATPELRRRFEQESDLLGRLQHPGICRIYEAGVADPGQLYFAMELVSGQPLLEYCEANRLDLRAKLGLMSRICDALQHAHQRGVIHRDLKPGNILVDKTGQPKILDFGVARVTDSDTRATRQTDVGQLIGTLAYMSPEQMLADPLELDTRSDVYALGVILYELLAGRLPYKVNCEVLLEAMRAVREDEPAPLRSVSTLYRGDIETIAAKALEKDKSRRYSSAAALGGDIERYLNNEPITARPPTTMYQVRKFASRHKPLVVGVAGVLLALSAGIVVSTWEAVRADREAATAKAISNFLQNDLLAQASANVQAGSSQKPDPDLKIRTALDRAAARIAGKFDGQPAVEASLRQTIGATYLDLGLYAQAQPHLHRAVDLRTQALGYAHPDTLSSLHSLALSYRYQGKYAQADELYTKVVNLRRRVLGESAPATLLSMNNLGVVYLYRDKYAEAEKIHARVWEIRKRLLGERHPDTLTSMSNLALAYENEGQYGAAEKLFIDTLKLERAVLGDRHPDTLRTLNHLAVTYNDQGKFVDAQQCLLEALKLRRETQGEQHPDTLVVINNLADAYLDQGDFDKALEMFNHLLSIVRSTLGDEHPDTLRCLINIAVTHRARGEFKQAEELNLKVLTLRRRILGPDHPNTLWALDALARNYLESGAYADAERVYADVIERRRRVLGPRHPRTLDSIAFMAQTLVLEGKFADAEPYAREALTGRQKAASEIWQLYHAKSVAGASLAGQKKHAEADPLLVSGYRGLLERQPTMPAEDRKLIVVSRNWLDKLGPGSGNTPLAKVNRAR